MIKLHAISLVLNADIHKHVDDANLQILKYTTKYEYIYNINILEKACKALPRSFNKGNSTIF